MARTCCCVPNVVPARRSGCVRAPTLTWPLGGLVAGVERGTLLQLRRQLLQLRLGRLRGSSARRHASADLSGAVSALTIGLQSRSRGHPHGLQGRGWSTSSSSTAPGAVGRWRRVGHGVRLCAAVKAESCRIQFLGTALQHPTSPPALALGRLRAAMRGGLRRGAPPGQTLAESSPDSMASTSAASASGRVLSSSSTAPMVLLASTPPPVVLLRPSLHAGSSSASPAAAAREAVPPVLAPQRCAYVLGDSLGPASHLAQGPQDPHQQQRRRAWARRERQQEAQQLQVPQPAAASPSVQAQGEHLLLAHASPLPRAEQVSTALATLAACCAVLVGAPAAAHASGGGELSGEAAALFSQFLVRGRAEPHPTEAPAALGGAGSGTLNKHGCLLLHRARALGRTQGRAHGSHPPRACAARAPRQPPESPRQPRACSTSSTRPAFTPAPMPHARAGASGEHGPRRRRPLCGGGHVV